MGDGGCRGTVRALCVERDVLQRGGRVLCAVPPHSQRPDGRPVVRRGARRHGGADGAAHVQPRATPDEPKPPARRDRAIPAAQARLAGDRGRPLRQRPILGLLLLRVPPRDQWQGAGGARACGGVDQEALARARRAGVL